MVGKSLFIITGASSGFGRALAVVLSETVFKNVVENSKLLLIARRMDDLIETKKAVLKNAKDIEIDTFSIDLSNPSAMQPQFNEIFQSLTTGDFKSVYFFNNAGTAGDVTKKLSEQENYAEFERVFTLNLTAGAFLVARVCKLFEASKIYIVNTSTLAAIQPMPYFSLYSASKAGMDAVLKSVALELPQVRALNYAPGPMDTEMSKDFKDVYGDPAIRESFRQMAENGTIVQPLDSARKLVALLQEDKFASGDHIDYYDI